MAESAARLSTRLEDGALWLTLDRPEVFNALDAGLAAGLAEALEQARGRDDIRVVAITGTGAAFCAGADIAPDAEDLDERALEAANRIVRAIVGLDKPVVAGVHGAAAGVGCSIAVACDLVVAAESANFLLAFARIGLMADGGATATVAASVGRARAMRMALLAEPLSGREAYDAGLATHLARDEDFPATLAHVVRRVVAGPPLALAAMKKAVNAATLPGLESALQREKLGQTVLLRTADAVEGLRAFVEKRPPTFHGH